MNTLLPLLNSRFLYWIGFLGLGAFLGTVVLRAEDAVKPATKIKVDSDQTEATPAEPKIEFDPTTIPEGGLPELLAYVKRGGNWQPKFDAAIRRDPAALKAVQAQISAARGKLIEAADKALALQPVAKDRVTLLRAKWNALRTQGMYGDEAADKSYDALIASLLHDADVSLVREAYKLTLLGRLTKFIRGKSNETAQAIAADITADLKDDAKRDDAIMVATSATTYFELRGHYDLSRAMYGEILSATDKVTDPKLQKILPKRVEMGLGKLGLMGQPAELKGKYLDGTDFDIASLKGKVVLIDFWASWCGPCIDEMPNVVENYKKYHDRGFEVIGVSIDDDKDKLEKFLGDADELTDLIKVPEVPWKTLFNEDEATRGFNDPQGRKYFVTGIPATYLVDKSGNIVHINVRGERLGQLLEELLGK